MSTVSNRRSEIEVDADDGVFGVHIEASQEAGGPPIILMVRLTLLRSASDDDQPMVPHGNNLASLRQLRDLITDALAEAERAGLV